MPRAKQSSANPKPARKSKGTATPMMRQYLAMKRAHPEALLMFRMGDFYETFFDDAKVLARELDLVLTARDRKSDSPIPLAGIPHHALENYLARLVRKGYRVAICDQIEDPKQAKGLVKRAITRIVSPGTVVEESLLSAANNFLVAIAPQKDGSAFGLAALDLSTGEFLTTQLEGKRAADRLVSELGRLSPAEVLMPSGTTATALESILERLDGSLVEPQAPENDSDPAKEAKKESGKASEQKSQEENVEAGKAKAAQAKGPEDRPQLARSVAGAPTITHTGERQFFLPEASKRLEQHFGVGSVEGLGLDPASAPLAVAAAGAALTYVLDLQESKLGHIQRPVPYSLADHMVLDALTQRNLELVSQLRGGGSGQTLLGALNETVTAGGARMLRQWVLQPLVQKEAIDERLDAVEHLHDDLGLRQELRDQLSGMADIERVLSRVGHGSANGRDLVALAAGLERVAGLRTLMGATKGDETASGRKKPNQTGLPELLSSSVADLDPHPQLADLLNIALVEDPPTTITEGNLIRGGFSDELDKLTGMARSGKEWIASLERQERDRTGIPSLKIGYNRVFGYYLEVTKKWVKRVPEDYHRKQTLANAERYVTPELKEKEATLLNAEEKAKSLEYELFCQLRDEVAGQLSSLQTTARALSLLDLLAGLAQVARDFDYCRPKVTEGGRITITEGRHPVVERSLALETGYVPNPCRMDDAAHQLLLITGPNMAGKSTYMRQVALTVLMAQMGSFVPARKAEIGLVDRIFTRVGASDDLAAGQSTFMVEMLELAHILANATPSSLVLLDEIGRGTATYDGLALAWAVAEHLHGLRGKGVKTLFATHYHTLTDLSRFLPRVKNLQVTAKEEGDRLIFLHQVIPGSADRSFGIQVGRLAGLPPPVIERAQSVLERLETQEKPVDTDDLPPPTGPTQTVLFTEASIAANPVIEYREHPVVKELQELDPLSMTPLEALEVLWKLKQGLE